MAEIKSFLKEAFIEEYSGAIEQLEKERYKNAVILFSKALFALCDLLIYERLEKLPKNHGERFKILKEYFFEIYEIVDNLFGYYQDACSKPTLKKNCENIKNGIQKITGNRELSEEIKRITK